MVRRALANGINSAVVLLGSMFLGWATYPLVLKGVFIVTALVVVANILLNLGFTCLGVHTSRLLMLLVSVVKAFILWLLLNSIEHIMPGTIIVHIPFIWQGFVLCFVLGRVKAVKPS
jgi:hypothetical protein